MRVISRSSYPTSCSCCSDRSRQYSESTGPTSEGVVARGQLSGGAEAVGAAADPARRFASSSRAPSADELAVRDPAAAVAAAAPLLAAAPRRPAASPPPSIEI